jgi:hypothetical protein
MAIVEKEVFHVEDNEAIKVMKVENIVYMEESAHDDVVVVSVASISVDSI